ncbi:hypothetical protein DI392_11730 [Vibrio albus]|uniref:Uncharacterized protein n=1 Tax=Vibrio albus TaxID=2200953 RepID=A0A2U3B852_9VIBR|nr:hypothetical protein [Vibrio albus]PWI32979.1 hypothetical protein DI392_11730 [Vibrio albus]
MADNTAPMPIDKDTVETKYYRWWLEICKLVNPNKRQSLRCAISIIEAYRCDMMYLHLWTTYRHASKQENFDRQQWTEKYINALDRYMERDKKRIHRIAAHCPNMLICIAGVINGVRRSTNINGTVRTILLLDIIDGTNIDLISELEMSHIRCVQKSHSVYLPLKEPEIYSIVSIVDNLLKLQPSLHKTIEEKYLKTSYLVARTLGVKIDIEQRQLPHHLPA